MRVLLLFLNTLPACRFHQGDSRLKELNELFINYQGTMDARKLANYLIALQELGGLSWDSQVRIEINGKEYELADYTGHQMPDNNPDHWYYLLRAVVPPQGKTIDWPAVEDKIRKRIYEEYQRANSMITDASLHVSLEDNITLIDSEKSTNTLIEFIRKELGL